MHFDFLTMYAGAPIKHHPGRACGLGSSRTSPLSSRSPLWAGLCSQLRLCECQPRPLPAIVLLGLPPPSSSGSVVFASGCSVKPMTATSQRVPVSPPPPSPPPSLLHPPRSARLCVFACLSAPTLQPGLPNRPTNVAAAVRGVSPVLPSVSTLPPSKLVCSRAPSILPIPSPLIEHGRRNVRFRDLKEATATS